MTFHPDTQAALAHQGRRMHRALHVERPPNRKEAELIQRRVDDILDRRPTVVGTMPDGEPVWSTATPWEMEQLLPAAKTIAVNTTGEPEQVLTAEQWQFPGDDGGGLAVIDCRICTRLGRYCGHDR